MINFKQISFLHGICPEADKMAPRQLSGLAPGLKQVHCHHGQLAFGSYEVVSAYYKNPQGVEMIINVSQRTGPAKILQDTSPFIKMYTLMEKSDWSTVWEIAKDAFPKMGDLLKNDHTVLVHCQEGKIRSGTIVGLYLMLIDNQPFAKMEKAIKSAGGQLIPAVRQKLKVLTENERLLLIKELSLPM